MRIAVVFAISVAVVLVLILTRPDTKAELQPLPAPAVDIEPVRLMDVQPVTVLAGKLRPARIAELRFEVSGRIVERLVEPGHAVDAGDLLLRISAGDFSDLAEESRALLEQEENAAERDRRLLELTIEETRVLERELERLARLGRDSLASQSQYDEILQRLLRQRGEEARLRYSVETAAARMAARRAAWNRSVRDLERSRLTAPFPATVNAVRAQIGDYVSPGQAAVELVDLSELDLHLEVTGPVAAMLSMWQEVRVLGPEYSGSGRIIAMAADPDPSTNTHALRIRLPGTGLQPGMLLAAELPGRALRQVPVVPIAAVLREESGAYVYRVRDRQLVKTPVQLLERHRDLQVVQGLDPGTVIVSRDVAALAEGQEVTVR
jgi:multidrug efflux system membrane fusion protein